jgi:hypothetical protein
MAGSAGCCHTKAARLVILVDQLEELFTAKIEPVRRDLFVRILAGLARSGVVWIVGTIRNDLWHRAAETPALLRLVEAGARLDLLRPDSSEIIEILRRPAASAGLLFEVDGERGVGLDAAIAAAAAEEPGVLPLLSVLLETLYDRDVAGSPASNARTLTFATYRDLGELKGAVASRADQVLASLAETDPEAAKGASQCAPRLGRDQGQPGRGYLAAGSRRCICARRAGGAAGGAISCP